MSQLDLEVAHNLKPAKSLWILTQIETDLDLVANRKHQTFMQPHFFLIQVVGCLSVTNE